MGILTALGISIGVLAGVLCVICDLLAKTGVVPIMIAAWPGFVAWACYFAIGGKKEGLGKVMAANTAGAIMGVLMIVLAGALSFLGGTASLAIAVAIGAFVLCVEAGWAPLSFIPGAFCGCACCFGFGVGTNISALIACVLSMWVGAVFAYASDVWGNAMVKKPALATSK